MQSIYTALRRMCKVSMCAQPAPPPLPPLPKKEVPWAYDWPSPTAPPNNPSSTGTVPDYNEPGVVQDRQILMERTITKVLRRCYMFYETKLKTGAPQRLNPETRDPKDFHFHAITGIGISDFNDPMLFLVNEQLDRSIRDYVKNDSDIGLYGVVLDMPTDSNGEYDMVVKFYSRRRFYRKHFMEAHRKPLSIL